MGVGFELEGPSHVHTPPFLPVCGCHHSQTVRTSGTLIFAGLSLAPTEAQTFLGGSKDSQSNLFSGWSWVDGTPASNLNCASVGCTYNAALCKVHAHAKVGVVISLTAGAWAWPSISWAFWRPCTHAHTTETPTTFTSHRFRQVISGRLPIPVVTDLRRK